MATKTEICKYALAKIGGGAQSNQITDVDTDGTTTADLCVDFYDIVRKEVISRGYWIEATKYADLDNATVTDKGAWSYASDAPTDYLSRLKVIYEQTHTVMHPEKIQPIRHQMMGSYVFTDLYTNSAGDKVHAMYVYDLSTEASFSVQLVEAIATKLGAELAPVIITEDGGYHRRMNLLNEYEKFLPQWLGENQMSNYRDDQGAATCLTIARWE